MASSNSKSSTQRDLQQSPDTGSKEVHKSRSCWGMADSKNSSSSMVGLKLGKRTYFEDGHDTQGEEKNSKNTVTTAAAVSKKARSSSQSGAVPKCQVEGCNADLSGSKEYHKRHKVCEEHSKTPKCIVNSQEQRFCQQCSRFHLLPEFDEGKRSCRRRLAGHNERRRKPQPDALAAYSMGNVSNFQAAYQRLGVASSILVDNHGEPLGYGSSGSGNGNGSGASTPASTWGRMGAHQHFLSKQLVESLSAEKLLLLLQNSKRSTGLPTVSTLSSTVCTSTSTPTVRSTNQDSMKLTLSSSSSRDVHAGDSRRALSLLSSSEAWNTSTTTKPYESSQFTISGSVNGSSSTSPADTEQDHGSKHQEHYGGWKYSGY